MTFNFRQGVGWVVLAGVAASCGPRPPGEPGGFDRRALVASLGEHVVLPTLKSAQFAAGELQTVTAAHLAAGGAGGAERAAAQAAWKRAMASWQRAELMQIGPAGNQTGGQQLRDNIYSWPTVLPCRVDQELVAHQFRSSNFFQGALVISYGLDALEYLLFHEGSANRCASTHAINAQGSWAALSPAELSQRRADYADAVAGRLVADLGLLVQAWEGEGGFLAQLQGAGSSGSAYGSAQVAMDEYFAALMYLDLRVKDGKLAEPAGLSAECGAEVCPEKVESPYARHSKENLVANLVGFQALLLGQLPGEEARVGFDDYLIARQAPELAQQLAERTQAALTAAEALSPGVEALLTQDPDSVRSLHASVKRITDLLKSQFVTVLNLRVPDEGASDND